MALLEHHTIRDGLAHHLSSSSVMTSWRSMPLGADNTWQGSQTVPALHYTAWCTMVLETRRSQAQYEHFTFIICMQTSDRPKLQVTCELPSITLLWQYLLFRRKYLLHGRIIKVFKALHINITRDIEENIWAYRTRYHSVLFSNMFNHISVKYIWHNGKCCHNPPLYHNTTHILKNKQSKR